MKIEVKSDKVFGLESWQVKMIVLPLGILVLAIISLIFVVIPSFNQLTSTNNQIKQKNIQIKNLEEKRNYLMNLNQDEVEANAEYLNLSLLKNKDAYYLVNVVRNVVEQKGFRIDAFSITPGEVEAETEEVAETSQTVNNKFGLTNIPVELTLLGPKSSYFDVVKALERTLPILSISNFEVKNIGEVAQIKLEVETYFVPDKFESNLDKLTLADLTLTQDEMSLVKTLSEYDKTAGAVIDSGLIKSGEFKNYDRENPFEL